MGYELSRIRVEHDAGVCFATIDNPPCNVITLELFAQLAELAATVAEDASARVLVLRSADPDFFLAHFDVSAILDFPTDTPAERAERLNDYHLMCEPLRTMGKATICQIEGRVGGGGSELSMACDMRFGVRGRTIICQMEVPLGILPGGTGTQHLPRLVGRNRALEVILGGDDLDAETAERWGYLNRIFEPDEIGPFVDALARRIASFPPEAIRLAKASVDAAEMPLDDGMREEAYNFQRLLRTEEAQRNMAAFMERGGQTPAVERRVGAAAGELGQPPD
jgi:enoyl-CoA hydratase/carnithine racemase